MTSINTATHLFAALAALTGDNWQPANCIEDHKNEALLSTWTGEEVFTIYVHRGAENWYVETQFDFKEDLAVTCESLADALRAVDYLNVDKI